MSTADTSSEADLSGVEASSPTGPTTETDLPVEVASSAASSHSGEDLSREGEGTSSDADPPSQTGLPEEVASSATSPRSGEDLPDVVVPSVASPPSGSEFPEVVGPFSLPYREYASDSLKEVVPPRDHPVWSHEPLLAPITPAKNETPSKMEQAGDYGTQEKPHRPRIRCVKSRFFWPAVLVMIAMACAGVGAGVGLRLRSKKMHTSKTLQPNPTGPSLPSSTNTLTRTATITTSTTHTVAPSETEGPWGFLAYSHLGFAGKQHYVAEEGFTELDFWLSSFKWRPKVAQVCCVKLCNESKLVDILCAGPTRNSTSKMIGKVQILCHGTVPLGGGCSEDEAPVI